MNKMEPERDWTLGKKSWIIEDKGKKQCLTFAKIKSLKDTLKLWLI